MKQSIHAKAQPREKEEDEALETYLAPPPPKDGRVISVDCHPDTFTAAVYKGQTPHDARKIESRVDMTLKVLLAWAEAEFTSEDIFLLEASGNSFAVCDALRKLGLRAVVLESQHVGKHAKIYADNDRMAAERIALVYFAGKAPAVWVPDACTRERRELMHVHRNATNDHTAATNTLKEYLNGHAIRLGNRSLTAKATRAWIEAQRDWSPLQKEMLAGYFSDLDHSAEQRRRYVELISEQIAKEPLMLRCMKLLGIGKINAFALMAIIGNVRRFDRAEKLVAYLGLNPGQRTSGTGKLVKVGVGKRGRGDLRHLLIQSAHAILRSGKATDLGKWGWKLFARKGHRNVAVSAVARKLVVQVWHLLRGNPPTALERDKSFETKLIKLAGVIGKERRIELGLGASIAECVQVLFARTQELASKPCDQCEPV
jgi:transposase